MNTKILKFELTTLLAISVVALLVFFKGDSIPDNYLSVSSSHSTNFFTYYFYSFLSGINYYSGMWIVFVFLMQIAVYVFYLSKRADIFDNFVLVPFSIFFSISLFYVKPNFLGQGVFQLIQNNVSAFGALGLIVASLFAGLYLIFRSGFLSVLTNGLSGLKPASESLVHSVGMLTEKVNDKISEKLSKATELKEEQANDLAQEKAESIVAKQDNEIPVAKVSESLPIALEAPVTNEETEQVEHVESEDVFGFDSEYAVELYEPEFAEAQEEAHRMVQKQEPKITDEAYFGLVTNLSAKKNEQRFGHPDDRYFQDIITKIHNKLAEFKIEGRIINVLKGPVVDTFEWELGAGEKISKLTSAAEDLSLALLGAPIRMVYPMKGRGTVGIEVPRNPREIIFLDEIISSKEYLSTNHQLPLAMGKDAFGEPVVVDLASMPHMLVAGATGAGKSVFINSILVSLLIKKSPAQMKLILIDPKQLELALYARLPHLIMPVITDAKTASVSLMWAVQEMERRYSIMTQMGVRNIEGFNHKLKRADNSQLANIRKFYEYETEDTYELPYIVVIVDEFADLILTASGKDIENNICRLAAKARAAGIHLVIATQRPSVDVITGLIKSNFPTRVSFRVTSAVDSRTILNSMGAEKLLGKGDMLYKYGVDTTRIHSSYVEEEDIESLTDKLAEIQPTFNDHVMDFLANGGEESGEIITTAPKATDGSEKDEKYDEAVRVVIEHRSASASLLQRRLGVGYNRAANLIEKMESEGVVGPAQGSKPRKVLLGSEGISQP